MLSVLINITLMESQESEKDGEPRNHVPEEGM